MFPNRLRTIVSALLLAGAACINTSGSAADDSAKSHPTVALTKQYFQFVVNEDWKSAASMLNPVSLERKKRRAVELIKRAPTMTAEAEMLGQLGVKDVGEIEKMSVIDFYTAERSGVTKRDEKGDSLRKQKQDSLQVNVLGVILEKEGTIAHLAVRTSQNVLDKKIDELIFISYQQDEADKSKWYIVPDMQVPVTTPLNAEGGDTKPAK